MRRIDNDFIAFKPSAAILVRMRFQPEFQFFQPGIGREQLVIFEDFA